MKIMVCGSRHTYRETIDIHARMKDILDENPKDTFIVGDAIGVDLCFIIAASIRKVEFTVCGIQDLPRVGGQFDPRYLRVGNTYTERDRYMCSQADKLYAFWNGESKGTLRNIREFEAANKPVVTIRL